MGTQERNKRGTIDSVRVNDGSPSTLRSTQHLHSFQCFHRVDGRCLHHSHWKWSYPDGLYLNQKQSDFHFEIACLQRLHAVKRFHVHSIAARYCFNLNVFRMAPLSAGDTALCEVQALVWLSACHGNAEGVAATFTDGVHTDFWLKRFSRWIVSESLLHVV